METFFVGWEDDNGPEEREQCSSTGEREVTTGNCEFFLCGNKFMSHATYKYRRDIKLKYCTQFS